MPRKSYLVPSVLFLVALFLSAGWLSRVLGNDLLAYQSPNQVVFLAGTVRQGLVCLSGEKGVGDIIAPLALGITDHKTGHLFQDTPEELAGHCYAYSVGFDPCTGQILYADAMLEFGPQPCPKDLVK